MNVYRLIALLLVVALLTVGMVSAQDERVLVIGHAEATDSLDPARGFNQTTGFLNHVVYDTLVTFPNTDASEILPSVATDWEISDDGLTYTFTLRDDVVFADGTPLTAEDAAFSIMRLKNVLGNPSFLAETIESAEALDDTTLVLTLSQPNPALLANLTSYVFSISNSEVVMANGGTAAEDAAETDEAETFLNNTSAGSGPYILESWEPDVQTVLVRNENYWGPEDEAGYFDRIIVVNIEEAATQQVALESGEIDLALDLTADQVNALEGNPDITTASFPSNIVHFILMNQNPEIGGPVSDPLVQLAVRYALDYEGYRELWGGITPGSIMAVGLQYAFPPEMAFERDVERARELLAEAGYPDGFEITLDYPVFTFQGVNMEINAQKIQSDLAEVGIIVNLNPGELQVSLEQYRQGNQAFGYWFWGPDVLDPIDTLSFAPNGKVGGERANWTDENADEEILDIVARGRVETDPAEREVIFTELQAYLRESGPWAPFIQTEVQVAHRADITGYVWHPQWLFTLTEIERIEG